MPKEIEEVQELISEAWALFQGHYPEAASPFVRAAGENLGRQFEFAEIGLAHRENGTPVWLAKEGSFEGKRIISAQGTSQDLVVQVDGDTDQARRALAAVWAFLDSGQKRDLQALSNICDKTIAMVRLPIDFDTICPVARILRDRVLERLKTAGLSLARDPLPHLSTEIVARIGALQLDRRVIFEPRATVLASKRVFFTQSPLATPEHMEMVKEIVRAATAPPSGEG